MLKDGVIDFKQDNWKVKGDYPINGEWTGKTFFRAYGPYESDYNVESMEIREAITDYEFVGREKEGEGMISMFSPRSIKGVFVEDNQATIRILENAKSPTFRHTDKTQRVNLSWLEEQFKRRWYKPVHVSSILQAVDILTKPFVNAKMEICSPPSCHFPDHECKTLQSFGKSGRGTFAAFSRCAAHRGTRCPV